MAHVYDFMAVISGKEVETYRYEQPLQKGFEKKPGGASRRKLNTEESELQKERKLNWARNQTKTKVRRLVNCNPQLNKFLTLTYAKNKTDTKITNGDFNQFIKRMVYEFDELQYLAVPEFQERGAVHYHLLCNLRYVPAAKIAKIWTHGFIKINRIDNIKNVGRYVSKYLTKDVFNERASKRKRFFCSRGLNRPVKLYGASASQFVGNFLSQSKPVYEVSYESEWTGEVQCKGYLLGFYPNHKDLFGN